MLDNLRGDFVTKASDGGLFGRFLIILFGLGVVLLGAYPLTREYGGVSNYVSIKADQFNDFIGSIDSGLSGGGERNKRARLSPERTKTKANSLPPAKTLEVGSGEPMGKVSKDERKKLDDLINTFTD